MRKADLFQNTANSGRPEAASADSPLAFELSSADTKEIAGESRTIGELAAQPLLFLVPLGPSDSDAAKNRGQFEPVGFNY